jgi:hypothetical protein
VPATRVKPIAAKTGSSTPFSGAKFDEFKAVEAQRVFEQVSHGSPQHALRMWRTV